MNESSFKIMNQFHPSKSTWAIISFKKVLVEEIYKGILVSGGK
jgi:hypothetical protein